MRIRVLTFFLMASAFLGVLPGKARGQTCPSVAKLTTQGEYSYNTTFGHHGGLDLYADIPVNSFFDFEPSLQLSTAGIYTAGLQTRASFMLGSGALFMKNRFLFKDVARSDMYDACLAISFGYRRNYLEIEAGMFGRFMDSFDRDPHSLDTILSEPFNLLYCLKGFARPMDSDWNAWLSVSNVDVFQMERMWQPIVSLGGFYDLTPRLALKADIICKPSGMFHLNAEFYSIAVRAGITCSL